MLTGKQKRFLRALAVNEKALIQIGKENLSQNLYNSIKEVLKTRELVKISVLKTCDLDMNELVIEICANTNSQLVQTIGRTIVLYKQSKEKIIQLP